MLYRVIDARELSPLIDAFMESYEVVAPVARGDGYVFDVVETPEDVVLDYPTTGTSIKKYLLPPKETLMKFDARTNMVTDYEEAIVPRVIFGVHACDINAVNRLDLVYRDGDYPDPYYCARRAATLIVGVSCTPTDTCFCNLLGADEAQFGYDLFFQRIGEQGQKYLVSISSVVGANILESACDPREATDEDRIEFRHATRARQAAFNPDIPKIQDIAMLMDAFHKDAFWEELGGRCLSCTACSAVCPTCFCFDIFDELEPNGQVGERVRVWDACTNPDFAKVTGGYNFRPGGRERVRHRMYHKLNGFFANYDRMLCVGCGRCVSACKANINPIEVLKFFERKGNEDAE